MSHDDGSRQDGRSRRERPSRQDGRSRHGRPSRRRRRWVAGTVAAGALLSAIGVAAAQGGPDQGAAFLASVRSVAHIVGVVASLGVAYYGVRARWQFQGGLFGEVAPFVVIGGLVFATAFVQMELQHGFGIDLLGFATGMQLKMGVRMVLFTVTVFAFGWAFYRMGSALEGV